jgi:purine catabolism regulator
VALREAAEASRVGRSVIPAGGALCFDDLGAYRYLLNVDLDRAESDMYVQAIERLDRYDDERLGSLVTTLEVYLANRHRVSHVAQRLGIHPNTLRQRLRRIEQLCGVSLDADDLLALELAIRVYRLRLPRPSRRPGPQLVAA